MTVTPIGPAGITPEVLVQRMAEKAGKMKTLFAVAFDEDGGAHYYCCGELSGLTLAILCFQDLALRLANGGTYPRR